MADRVLSAMRRLLYGDRREGGERTGRTKARETALRYRPWKRGKIGNIEKRISRAFDDPHEHFTTGELVRLIYANVAYDQNFHPRPEGAPLPELITWMFGRVRRGARLRFAIAWADREAVVSHAYGAFDRINTGAGPRKLRNARSSVAISRGASKSGHRQGNP